MYVTEGLRSVRSSSHFPLLPPLGPDADPAAYVPTQVETSSTELNAVWDLCQYTVVATGLDVYTDSNTRQRSVICMEALTINLLMQVCARASVEV